MGAMFVHESQIIKRNERLHFKHQTNSTISRPAQWTENWNFQRQRTIESNYFNDSAHRHDCIKTPRRPEPRVDEVSVGKLLRRLVLAQRRVRTKSLPNFDIMLLTAEPIHHCSVQSKLCGQSTTWFPRKNNESEVNRPKVWAIKLSLAPKTKSGRSLKQRPASTTNNLNNNSSTATTMNAMFPRHIQIATILVPYSNCAINSAQTWATKKPL